MTDLAVDLRMDKKARRSWYMYDFGNSAYAAVVLLAVYSVYFSSVVADHIKGPSLWNLAVGIAAVIVAVVSPVLGTIADFSRAKKKFLLVFTLMAVVFTGMLFFVQKGDVFIGILFFILAEVGYRASQVFYDALLVDVSTLKRSAMSPARVGRWACWAASPVLYWCSSPFNSPRATR